MSRFVFSLFITLALFANVAWADPRAAHHQDGPDPNLPYPGFFALYASDAVCNVSSPLAFPPPPPPSPSAFPAFACQPLNISNSDNIITYYGFLSCGAPWSNVATVLTIYISLDACVNQNTTGDNVLAYVTPNATAASKASNPDFDPFAISYCVDALWQPADSSPSSEWVSLSYGCPPPPPPGSSSDDYSHGWHHSRSSGLSRKAWGFIAGGIVAACILICICRRRARRSRARRDAEAAALAAANSVSAPAGVPVAVPIAAPASVIATTYIQSAPSAPAAADAPAPAPRESMSAPLLRNADFVSVVPTTQHVPQYAVYAYAPAGAPMPAAVGSINNGGAAGVVPPAQYVTYAPTPYVPHSAYPSLSASHM